MMKVIASRIVAADWIVTERREYSDVKYGPETESRHKLVLDMRNWGLHEDGEWWVFITNYLKRAQLLGVDTKAGQQALGKLVVTLIHAFETSIEVFGKPPMPGVPSGEVEEWQRG